jgi:hypothetical protein
MVGQIDCKTVSSERKSEMSNILIRIEDLLLQSASPWRIPALDFNLSKPEIRKERVEEFFGKYSPSEIGRNSRYTLYKIEDEKNNEYVIFATGNKTKDLIFFLGATKNEIPQQRVGTNVTVKNVWRGLSVSSQGLTKKVYDNYLSIWGSCLISDERQTDKGVGLWQRRIAENANRQCGVLDSRTGEIIEQYDGKEDIQQFAFRIAEKYYGPEPVPPYQYYRLFIKMKGKLK